MLVLVVGASLAVLVAALSVGSRSQALRRREARSSVSLAGKSVPLASAVWALASTGGAERVGSYLADSRVNTAQGVADGLTAHFEQLSETERLAMAGHIQRIERARAERRLWSTQAESITGAATAGLLDGLILDLGQNPDWLGKALRPVAGSVDLSHHVVGGVVHHAAHGLDHVMPNTTESLVDHLDHTFGATIDAAAAGVGDTALHGLAAVADSHIPLVTIGRAVYRAKTASDAGLESSRVRENLVLDAGVTGGAVATGATIGTMIFPIVGTVIGGVLGGIFGRGVASVAKERHLVGAQRVANEWLYELGTTVPAKQWMTMSDTLSSCIKEQDHALAQLKTLLGRGWKPLRSTRLGRHVLAAAIEAGDAEIRMQRDDLREWNRELQASAGTEGAAFRGSVLAIRPDLVERLGAAKATLESALEAQERVRDERGKLQLA